MPTASQSTVSNQEDKNDDDVDDGVDDCVDDSVDDDDAEDEHDPISNDVWHTIEPVTC